jgi:hypothetical protein
VIARVDLSSLDDLKRALPRFAHRPLAHLSYLKPEQVEAYWLDEIALDLADESAVTFLSRGSTGVQAFVSYADSPWDTSVVGRRMGVIKHIAETNEAGSSATLDALLEEVIRDATRRGIECLTCRVQARHLTAIHALQRHGFLLMDTLLDFLFDSTRTPLESINVPRPLNNLRTRLATPADLAEVLRVTQKMFATYFGRYHSDPKMPPGTGTKVYEEWVRSAFAGWADWILLAEVDGRIAGYTLWQNPSGLELKHSLDTAHCRLGGIHPAFFEQGLYSALKLEAMRVAHNYAEHFDQPTHACNYPAHRGTLKLGWKIAGVRHSFHKWLQM